MATTSSQGRDTGSTDGGKRDSAKGRSGNGIRLRVRCWMFTVQLDLWHSAEGEPVEPAGDQCPKRVWDPNGVAFDDNTTRFVYCQLERCPSSGRLHWQGYIELLQAVGLKRVKEVLECDWTHLEPRRGTQVQAIDYCKKSESQVRDEDGSPLNFEWGEPARDGVRNAASKNANYAKMLEASTYQEALQLCQELEPADYVRYGASVKRGLMAHFLKVSLFIRPLSDFTHDPIPETIFKRLAVVFTGKSNAGKTAFALAHFKQPYLISHMDQLKEFNPLEHDGIVFDDMSFRHLPPETCIHLVDLEYDRFIHCRHHTGFLPKGMPRMFTSNKPFMHVFNFDACDEQQDVAIKRRIHHLLVNQALF